MAPAQKIVPEATAAGEAKLSTRTSGPARARYWLTVLRWTQTYLVVLSLETVVLGRAKRPRTGLEVPRVFPPWKSRLRPPRDRSGGDLFFFLVPWSEMSREPAPMGVGR